MRQLQVMRQDFWLNSGSGVSMRDIFQKEEEKVSVCGMLGSGDTRAHYTMHFSIQHSMLICRKCVSPIALPGGGPSGIDTKR
jgi:hypothetical protein